MENKRPTIDRLAHPFMAYPGWWIFAYPSEKYDFVNWDDKIPNTWKNKSHVPNHQPAYLSAMYEKKNVFSPGKSAPNLAGRSPGVEATTRKWVTFNLGDAWAFPGMAKTLQYLIYGFIIIFPIQLVIDWG